jgi:hypothetical protein
LVVLGESVDHVGTHGGSFAAWKYQNLSFDRFSFKFMAFFYEDACLRVDATIETDGFS